MLCLKKIARLVERFQCTPSKIEICWDIPLKRLLFFSFLLHSSIAVLRNFAPLLALNRISFAYSKLLEAGLHFLFKILT